MQLMLMLKKSKIVRIAALVLPVICLVVLLATTAFAQRTYVITDGDQVIVHTSYTADPKKALHEAGFRLDENDTYTTQTTDGVSEITVQRGQKVVINNCGEILEAHCNGETVQQLLDRLGIPTYGNYRVSEALHTATYDGLQINVDYVIHQTETYTVELPYQVTYCYDPTMEEGQERVITVGSAGQMLCSADVVYVNAVEQNRTLISETVARQPVNQVVAIGTGEDLGGKKDLPLIGDGVIVLPSGEVLTYSSVGQFVATAYTKTDEGCDEITSTGSHVRVGVVAVDPKVIPYGTRMFIVTNDGAYIYGLSTAEDCGGSIKGNRLDLYFETDPECWQFGIRDCTVYFLGDANWRDL